jgi:hypothetical protein
MSLVIKHRRTIAHSASLHRDEGHRKQLQSLKVFWSGANLLRLAF